MGPWKAFEAPETRNALGDGPWLELSVSPGVGVAVAAAAASADWRKVQPPAPERNAACPSIPVLWTNQSELGGSRWHDGARSAVSIAQPKCSTLVLACAAHDPHAREGTSPDAPCQATLEEGPGYLGGVVSSIPWCCRGATLRGAARLHLDAKDRNVGQECWPGRSGRECRAHSVTLAADGGSSYVSGRGGGEEHPSIATTPLAERRLRGGAGAGTDAVGLAGRSRGEHGRRQWEGLEHLVGSFCSARSFVPLLPPNNHDKKDPAVSWDTVKHGPPCSSAPPSMLTRFQRDPGSLTPSRTALLRCSGERRRDCVCVALRRPRAQLVWSVEPENEDLTRIRRQGGWPRVALGAWGHVGGLFAKRRRCLSVKLGIAKESRPRCCDPADLPTGPIRSPRPTCVTSPPHVRDHGSRSSGQTWRGMMR